MADFNNDDRTFGTTGTTTIVEPARSNTRTIVIGVLVAVFAIVGVLFATGFWSADVSGGALPAVSIKGGDVPDVALHSKEVVVGTAKTTIDVPTVGTKKVPVDVPVVGVKDDKNK